MHEYDGRQQRTMEVKMTHAITREEILVELARGADLTLIEALPARYYADGHLPGARHMPHDQVRSLAPRLLPDRQATIVVYCANAACRNSSIAAEALRALGYANVREYADGKADWIAAGLPLHTGGEVGNAA
jgi:rhodanese-related sulfurtransferase